MEQQVKAGVYQSVDSESLKRIKEEHESKIRESKAKGQIWAKHKQEYEALLKKLETITDKTAYEVTVPLGGKKAFMEGTLIHTNEILVLLGDNWFAERSAKESREICSRRLQNCQEMLDKIDGEIKLYESWLKEAEQLAFDSERGEGNLEIREPYNEEAEAEWRREHRQRVRESKKQNTDGQDQNQSQGFKDLLRRLDELEVEEELEAHLAKQNHEDSEENEEALKENMDHFVSSLYGAPKDRTKKRSVGFAAPASDSESDLSESPPLTDDDLDEDIIAMNAAQPDKPEPHHHDHKLSRKISFGNAQERLFSRQTDYVCNYLTELHPDTKVIEVHHGADVAVVDHDEVGKVPNSPGDLLEMYGVAPRRQSSSASSISPEKPPTPKKSILKMSSKYDSVATIPAEAVIPEEPAVSNQLDDHVQAQAVGEQVVERSPEQKQQEEEPYVKPSRPWQRRRSRFKDTRENKDPNQV